MGWDNPSTFDKIALDSSENFYLKFIIVKVSVDFFRYGFSLLKSPWYPIYMAHSIFYLNVNRYPLLFESLLYATSLL